MTPPLPPPQPPPPPPPHALPAAKRAAASVKRTPSAARRKRARTPSRSRPSAALRNASQSHPHPHPRSPSTSDPCSQHGSPCSSDHDGSGGTGNSATSMACLFCRKRKIKCNGAKPTCASCATYNIECNYQAVTAEENTALRMAKRARRARLAASLILSAPSLQSNQSQHNTLAEMVARARFAGPTSLQKVAASLGSLEVASPPAPDDKADWSQICAPASGMAARESTPIDFESMLVPTEYRLERPVPGSIVASPLQPSGVMPVPPVAPQAGDAFFQARKGDAIDPRASISPTATHVSSPVAGKTEEDASSYLLRSMPFMPVPPSLGSGFMAASSSLTSPVAGCPVGVAPTCIDAKWHAPAGEGSMSKAALSVPPCQPGPALSSRSCGLNMPSNWMGLASVVGESKLGSRGRSMLSQPMQFNYAFPSSFVQDTPTLSTARTFVKPAVRLRTDPTASSTDNANATASSLLLSPFASPPKFAEKQIKDEPMEDSTLPTRDGGPPFLAPSHRGASDAALCGPNPPCAPLALGSSTAAPSYGTASFDQLVGQTPCLSPSQPPWPPEAGSGAIRPWLANPELLRMLSGLDQPASQGSTTTLAQRRGKRARQPDELSPLGSGSGSVLSKAETASESNGSITNASTPLLLTPGLPSLTESLDSQLLDWSEMHVPPCVEKTASQLTSSLGLDLSLVGSLDKTFPDFGMAWSGDATAPFPTPLLSS